MEKIPTLFERDDKFKVVAKVHPDCQWVRKGEGFATEKLDGTNVRLTTRKGLIVRVEKRRNPSKEQKKQGIKDGWYMDADPEDPSNKWIYEAVLGTTAVNWPDDEHSCEAIGPKIQGNPLGLEMHVCVPFNLYPPVIMKVPRSYVGLREYLATADSMYSPGHLMEGIVFHHSDGRRAKIKRKDFPK